MKFEPLNVEEYRMIERDKRESIKHSFTVGTKIKADKYVKRVGYLVHPKSFTYQEWYDTGINILAQETKLSTETIETVITKLDLYSPFKGIRTKIYGALVERKRNHLIANGAKDIDLRSLWFVDTEVQGTIIKRVNRWTGIYHYAHFGGQYESYEPASLYPMYAQRLYLVDSNIGKVLVYPDDITT